MIRKLARYLIRFDDLCPTMSRAGWDRFELVIQEFNIRPILAVVPENQDPDLMLDAPDPEFWERMRKLEAAGATIAAVESNRDRPSARECWCLETPRRALLAR